MLKNIDIFSGYSVRDRGESLKFYKEVLGLSVAETDEGLNIQLKNGGKLFLYQKPDHSPASFTVLNLVVEDIDQAVDELRADGIDLENYDVGEMKADENGIYRGSAAGRGPDIAWFKDPSGNILSVIQN